MVKVDSMKDKLHRGCIAKKVRKGNIYLLKKITILYYLKINMIWFDN